MWRDSIVKGNKVLLSLVGRRDMLISIHKTRTSDWDFLIILDMQKASKIDLLKDQIETVLTMAGNSVTNRNYNGINILEMSGYACYFLYGFCRQSFCGFLYIQTGRSCHRFA